MILCILALLFILFYINSYLSNPTSGIESQQQHQKHDHSDSKHSNGATVDSPDVGLDSSASSSFLVIGDWGMLGEKPNQINVANAMAEISTQLKSEFVVSCGDHFYDNGVLFANDSKFTSGFEDVYSDAMGPWYLVLGNHDTRGSVKTQIKYSESSKKWNMPHNYFHQDFKMPPKKNDDKEYLYRIIFIDTNSLMCDHDEYATLNKLEAWECNETWYKMSEEFVARKQGVDASVVKKLGLESNFVRREEQLRWLLNLVEESERDDKIACVFVAAHHSLWSQGPHGIPSVYDSYLLPILQMSGKIKMYLAGHNHALEHYIWSRKQKVFLMPKNEELTSYDDIDDLKINENIEEGYGKLSDLHLILSGAGGAGLHLMEGETVESQLDYVKLGYLGRLKHGFVSVTLDWNKIALKYWSESAQMLYQTDFELDF